MEARFDFDPMGKRTDHTILQASADDVALYPVPTSFPGPNEHRKRKNRPYNTRSRHRQIEGSIQCRSVNLFRVILGLRAPNEHPSETFATLSFHPNHHVNSPLLPGSTSS